MMLKRKPDTKPDLGAEIERIRGELDAFLDAKTKELYLASPGLPEPTCRQLIMRGNGCRCAVVKRLLEDERKVDA